MTGQSIMNENSLSNDVANDTAGPSMFDEVNGSKRTAVATLNVTSEEINCNGKSWKTQTFTDTDGANFDHKQNERKQTDAWSFRQNNQNSKKKHSGNNKEIHQVKENPIYVNKRYNSFDSYGTSKCKSQDSITTTSKQINIVSDHDVDKDNTNNFPNGKLHIDNNDEDLSGFTDVSLSRSVANDEQKESIVISPSTSNVKKSTIGSLIDWISSSRNSIYEDATANFNDAAFYDAHSDFSCSTLPSSSSFNKSSGLKLIHEAIKSSLSLKQIQKNKIEPRSTTALIFENRPRNLPSKPEKESQKHRAEYNKMIANAKKHELKDSLKRLHLIKKQQEYEENIAKTSTVWLKEILPNWSTLCTANRTRQLWWQGLPPNVRGKVWKLAIGNELNVTEDLYNIMVIRANEKLRLMNQTPSTGVEEPESIVTDRESTVELIQLDISRTFPHLCIFQTGGPYHQLLHDILGAYACYRPDVGYVQGMSFMAAMLLLNMRPDEAFITFANLLNKPCQVAFFRLNEEGMKAYFATYEVFFEENLPKLFAYFKMNNLTPDMYLIDWIFTMFSKALDLDTASRVWDVFCRDGEDFLFRTAIAILKLNDDQLLSMEFIQAAQYLTRLPSTFTHHELFDVIADVNMLSRGHQRWKDVLSLMKDGT